MNIHATAKLLTLATLLAGAGLASTHANANAHANAHPNSTPSGSRPNTHQAARVKLMAQAAPPAPAASAPAAEAQPENRDTPVRPPARKRGVGVVISMSLA